MFQNFFKIAVRNLSRQKMYSLINISGLALGMAGSLLMFAFVINELSYEDFHRHKDQIYRVAIEFGQGENTMKLAGAMPALGPALADELPEVLQAVRFQRETKTVLKYGDKEFREDRFFFTDSSVFQVFTFPLISGDPATALRAPFSVVISEEIARKYFGSEEAVGKVLQYMDQYEFHVTGVMQDVPPNTHLKPDFLASFASLDKIAKVEHPWNQFGTAYTYLFVHKKAALPELQTKIKAVFQKHTNEQFAGMFSFHLQPIGDIYLTSKMMGELGPSGNLTYVYLFSSIALLVLLIACLNFVNLSTARSFRRAKEIGLRKVLGATRTQLAKQFLGESLIFTSIALVFSLLLFEMLFPRLTEFLGTKMVVDYFRNFYFYLTLAGIMIFVSLVAGLYPALFLSRYAPVQTLKNIFSPDMASALFRKILVVTQFAISIFLLVGTFVVYRQLHFMQETDLGFNKDNVVLVSFPAGDEQMQTTYFTLRDEFAKIPGVVSVSGAYTVPGLHNEEQQSVRLKDSSPDDFIMMRAIGVDYDYVQTLGLEVIKGRNFSKAFATDITNAILINEKAAETLGLADPVGREVLLPGNGTADERFAKIVGVVRDFHVQSLHTAIEPVFLYINPKRFYTIAVRVRPERLAGTLQALEAAWKAQVPDQPFQYTFLAETYNSLYDSETKTSQMAALFSLLAIYIACMGLLGLASFTAEQRTKEIGIRKVLGATVANVVTLLSNDFVKLVLLANLIAWPVAWYAMNKWLQNFAYRISIEWWVFALAGGLALVIALMTVSTQAVRAAMANPVESLRYE